MLKYNFFILILITNLSGFYNNNLQIGLDKLKINISKLKNGIQIDSIKYETHKLITNTKTDLFTLKIKNTINLTEQTINSSSGWKDISIKKSSYKGIITLSQPQNYKLPNTLRVIIKIEVQKNHSTWDINVSGLGNNHSLINVRYPTLSIKADGNDSFFTPYYHGKVFKNPLKTKMNYQTLYPRGWTATMQYMAYYNDNYGLYFGMHDPKASLKNFGAISKNNGIEISQNLPVENKTLANNDWELPGHFELILYHGDWYEASMIYRSWVFEHANYRPADTPDRVARQKKIGSVSMWVQESVKTYNLAQLESHIREFKEYMDIPIGVAWTSFNGKKFDTLYPEIFPQKNGLKGVISRLKNTYGDDLLISGYLNGMLYDMDNLDSYKTKGKPESIKKIDGEVESKRFDGTLFAYMCPAQKVWQDILSDTTKKMTKDIGFDVAYIDMVTAAGAKECFDKTHNHPIGGGSYWRYGYKKIFHNMHRRSANGTPFISEEANDFLIDEVDAFLTIGFVTNNQVPALSAVYGGKIQMIGTAMGWSDYKGSEDLDSQKFYARLAQSFSFGVQQGRFWMGLVSSKHKRSIKAAKFVRKLGRIRSKLKDYISFGRMLKPLEIIGNIPTITFPPYNYPKIYQDDVVMSSIQTSTWTDGNSIAIIFINAKIDESVNFSFDFNTFNYDFLGKSIKIKEISENNDGRYKTIQKKFSKDINLKALGSKVFIIKKL